MAKGDGIKGTLKSMVDALRGRKQEQPREAEKEYRALPWGGYEPFAEEFDKGEPYTGWVWDVLKQHLGTLNVTPATANVLDVGCGTGRSTRGLRLDGFARAVGVDPAEGMVKQARTHNDDIPYHVAPASKLPFPDESFDVVTIYWAFDNFGNDKASVDEIRRVLRPGGICMVITGTIEGFAREGRGLISQHATAREAPSTGFTSSGRSSAGLLRKYGFDTMAEPYVHEETREYTAAQALQSFRASKSLNLVPPEDRSKVFEELEAFCKRLAKEDEDRGGKGVIHRSSKLIVDIAFK